jgi:hypothetical protein
VWNSLPSEIGNGYRNMYIVIFEIKYVEVSISAAAQQSGTTNCLRNIGLRVEMMLPEKKHFLLDLT